MAPNAGMVGTKGSYRLSFFSYLVWLYKSDTTFRSVVDFTAIGTVVLAFLYFAPTRQSAPGGATSSSTQTTAQPKGSQSAASTKPAVEPKAAQPAANAKAAAPSAPSAAVTLPAGVAIQFPTEVTQPSIGNFVIVDIDDSLFKRSTPTDQPRLAAAARAFRSDQFAEIGNLLADANAADPNVAFMRALAFVNVAGENARLAEPLLRAASNGGVRQASILLGRMLVRPPVGVGRDTAQGRKLIETAAAAGDRLAQRLAGIAYLTDDFGGVNPAKARELLRSAAQAGDAEAMFFAAFTLGMALGGPADQRAAADLLRRSASEGLTVAQTTVGTWLLDEFKHHDIDDPGEGIEWLQRAYKVGLSMPALLALVHFYAAKDTPAPWSDKTKAYELARLCAGLAHGLCQDWNGWLYENGVGIERDLIKAWAYFHVAADLNFADAKSHLQRLEGKLTPDQEAKAIELSRAIRASLKPVPRPWAMQYVGAKPPPPPWAAASDAAPSSPASQSSNQPPLASANANARPAAPASQQTHPQAPAAPAFVPASRRGSTTLKQVTYKGGNLTGKVTRLSATEWVGEWVAEGSQDDHFVRYATISETPVELVVRNISDQQMLKLDLTGRHIFVRQGADWVAQSEISGIEPAKPVMRLPLPEEANDNFADHIDRYVEAQDEKAFAVNDHLHHFAWVGRRKTRDDAIADALKNCGADCKLYAVGDKLVH